VYVLTKDRRTGSNAKLTISNRDTESFCFELRFGVQVLPFRCSNSAVFVFICFRFAVQIFRFCCSSVAEIYKDDPYWG
jgi:hypothetical protein